MQRLKKLWECCVALSCYRCMSMFCIEHMLTCTQFRCRVLAARDPQIWLTSWLETSSRGASQGSKTRLCLQSIALYMHPLAKFDEVNAQDWHWWRNNVLTEVMRHVCQINNYCTIYKMAWGQNSGHLHALELWLPVSWKDFCVNILLYRSIANAFTDFTARSLRCIIHCTIQHASPDLQHHMLLLLLSVARGVPSVFSFLRVFIMQHFNLLLQQRSPHRLCFIQQSATAADG